MLCVALAFLALVTVPGTSQAVVLPLGLIYGALQAVSKSGGYP
jgi:hypothetical protein